MSNFNDLFELTPVEHIGNLWFKRGDKFSPQCDGGVNGDKLRLLSFLVKKAKDAGARGIIAGAVSGSPQSVMCSVVAKNYGLPYVSVVGTKEIEKYPMLKLAQSYGATFEHSNVGYAKCLESKAFALSKTEKYKDYHVIQTNITLSEKLNTPEEIKAFHAIGAAQVQNLPDSVDTIIIPCGSLNSCVSILYGIFLYKKTNIKHIYLMGIGSLGSKDIGYARRRLAGFEPKAEEIFSQFEIHYHNTYGEGGYKYEDEIDCEYNGIKFHKRYEAKVFQYLIDKNILPALEWGNSLFWVIGGSVTK